MKHLYCAMINGNKIYRYGTTKSIISAFRRYALDKWGKFYITDLSAKIDNKWTKILFNLNRE